MDLNGAFEGKPVNGEVVTAIARRYPNLPIQIGGGIRSLETIEHYSPCRSDFSHPCLQTMDMQATIDALRARGGTAQLGEPGIGLTRRWIYNALNPDGVRVEFSEPFCIK